MNKKDIIQLTTVITKLDDLKDDIKKDFKYVNSHLKELNSQTKENTKFRLMTKGALKIVGFVVGSGGILTFLYFLFADNF